MDKGKYSAPVKTLLTYGSAREMRDWSQYRKLGFSQEHIPELIAMLTDENLYYTESTGDEMWAPIHAWRTLGQLRAIEAIPALLDQLYHIDEDGDDWIGEEFPDVFALIGPPAISGLGKYLMDSQYLLYARICAAHSLSNLGKRYSKVRQECIESLEEPLRMYRQNDPTLNGFLVSFLLELKAIEALATIQDAYQAQCVDLSITGDCEDAEIELGVRSTRTTPRPRFGLFGMPETSRKSSPASRKKKKVGRNDPCPCGSGKKYKKCCLNKKPS